MRCDTCRFWVAGEQYGEQLEKHPDDKLGGCHRYAPRPTLGDYEYRALQALVMIVPVEGNSDDQLHDLIQHWEEATHSHPPIWPATSGSDWCGEHQVRE